MVFGLLSIAIATRYVPEELVGAFFILSYVGLFLSQGTTLGLGYATIKFAAATEDEEEIQGYINTAISARLLIVTFVAGLAWFIRIPLSRLFDTTVILESFIYLPLLFAGESIYRTMNAILRSRFLFKNLAIAETLSSTVNLIFTALFVIVFDMGMVGLVYAKFISLGVASLFAFLVVPVKKRFHIHREKFKQMVKFGFPLQLNQILDFVYSRLDTFMIAFLLGPADIAYYEIARKIPENLQSAYEAFDSVYFPVISNAFSKEEKAEGTSILNHATRLISFITIFGTLIATLFGYELIVFLFSDRYTASVFPFILLMLALNLRLIDWALGNGLVAIGESDKPVVVNIVHTAISFVVNLVITPILGTIGAALSTLAGLIGKNPLVIFFLHRKKVKANAWGYVFPILIFAAVFLPLLGLGQLTHGDYTYLLFGNINWVLRGVMLLAFVGVCFAFSIITRQDAEALISESKKLLARWTKKQPADS
jgi:O-antigen/teichoic acid export membrane protein